MYPGESTRSGVPGEKVWFVHGAPALPSTWLAVLIGDCLYNARSALDHLAWQLVVVNCQSPSTHTAFPIFNDPSLYKRFSKRKLDGMHDDAVAAIKDIQPCYGRNRHWNRTLWALETLGNIDKHRHVNLLVTSTSGAFWSHGLPVDARTFMHYGPLEDGQVVAKVPGEHADVDLHLRPYVAFGEAERFSRESIEQVLFAIITIVGDVVRCFHHRFFAPKYGILPSRGIISTNVDTFPYDADMAS